MTEKTSERPLVKEPSDAITDERSRMGWFNIAAPIFQGAPDLVRKILLELEFIPHFVQPIQDPACMHFMGNSPKFEQLRQGEDIPEYHIQIRECDDGAFHVKLARQEERRIVLPGQ